MSNQFARIIESSDGRQVLIYVEPEGGDYSLHQIADYEGYQADMKIGFTSPDEDANERKAYAALGAYSQEHADQVVRMMADTFGQLIGGAS